MTLVKGVGQKIKFFPNGTSVNADSGFQHVSGGRYSWSIQGTLTPGTVTLYELGDDGVTSYQIGAARTTNDAGNTPNFSGTDIYLPAGAQIKAIVTGSPGGLIYSSLNRIPE